jgi:carboxypeptidase Taq
MMDEKLKEDLSYVSKVLDEAENYGHALHILNYDLETICPPAAREKQGELGAFFSLQYFKLVKSKKFIASCEELYQHKDELEPLDQVLACQMHRYYMHTKNITPSFQHRMSLIYSKAYVDWLQAKEKKDFSLFAPSLKKVRDVQLKAVALREEKFPLPYDNLIDDGEMGITTADLDIFFNACKERLIPLLKRIEASPKKIRTDFLSRPVPIERQKPFSDYLLKTIGFDFNRGAITTTEHPFTDGLAENDVRVTTHYYENSFISNLFTVVHEGGHAIFEQRQQKDDFAHHINENISMGVHESVSRFYENRLGRSKAFIHLIYPKIQELYGDIFGDISEQEMYEGINAVQPSLVRTEADEFTYTFHIIIRYEIEKMIVDEKVPISQLKKIWNSKYKEYLGIVPPDDKQGILQDVHWASGFGYFPSYAIGNAYNAMYYNRMNQDFDIAKAVSEGRFDLIGQWMEDHVFRNANRLDDKAWIKDVTGRSFTPDDFLDYLEKKYSELYEL